MVLSDFQEQLCQYIAFHLPEDVLRQFEENVLIEHGELEDYIQRRFKFTKKNRIRSQMRRYSTDEAMAALQEICSSIEVRETEPKGEYYVVLNKSNLTLSHIELYEGEKARPAVHRTKLAKINRKYEPDLFSELEDRSEENSLHVVLTIIKPGAKEETQVAPNILVSVPYSDFKGFHMQVELNDFFAYYTQKPDVIEIDMAWPSFREEILREEEKLRKNDSDG